MHVRTYTPADRDACLAVFQSNVPDYFVPAEREEFAAFLEALPGPYLVIEDAGGGIVGCGGYAVEADGATATFCWGMVARERHRTGLGCLLARERLNRISQDPSLRAVALHTSQHTRPFYEQLGFRAERVVPDGYAPGLDRCDMRLVLPAAGLILPDPRGAT